MANNKHRLFFYGIWFLPIPDMKTGKIVSDFMGNLFHEEDGPWVFEYRFRYYSPESTDPMDDKDRKSWYTVQGESFDAETLQKLITAAKLVTDAMVAKIEEAGHTSEFDFVKMDCWNDDPKFFFELGSRPWAHVKKLTKEEVEKL